MCMTFAFYTNEKDLENNFCHLNEALNLKGRGVSYDIDVEILYSCNCNVDEKLLDHYLCTMSFEAKFLQGVFFVICIKGFAGYK